MNYYILILALIISGCSTTLHKQKVDKKIALCGESHKSEIDLFFFAIRNNDLKKLKKYFKKYRKINRVDHKGNNLLHIAVRIDNPSIINYLISKRIKINHQNHKGDTPLHLAIKYAKPNAVEILLKNKNINIFISNQHGNIPHILVNRKMNDTIIKICIETYWNEEIYLIKKGDGQYILNILNNTYFGKKCIEFLKRHNYLPKEYYQSSLKN